VIDLQDKTSNHKSTNRGFNSEDLKSFSKSSIQLLNRSAIEICYLLDRGYDIKNITTFVGNHYQLTARQRTALQRSCCSTLQKDNRIKSLINDVTEKIVYIDGFNIIITLEVALSNGTLFKCRDNCIRDLAGLRGTYRLIDKTSPAIELLALTLKRLKASKVIFYLDEPVSNSINLKIAIINVFEKIGVPVSVHVVPNPDYILKDKSCIITTDSVIIDSCKGWINICPLIINRYIPNTSIIDFMY
jgi:hypothetical protein